MTRKTESQPLIADNRKALFDYHILETFEAGIALLGTEVKGIREGKANLRDSYARVENGEVWLYNVHISPYSHRGYADHDPKRRRKLLMHREEIRKLIGKTVEKGLTLVPMRLYFKNGRIKVALALARGKQVHDKRETIRRREIDRETRAMVKERRRCVRPSGSIAPRLSAANWTPCARRSRTARSRVMALSPGAVTHCSSR